MQDNPYDKACRYLAKLDPAALLAFLLSLDYADFECNLSTFSAADILEQIAQGKQGRVILPWIPLMQSGGESGIIERWKEIATAEPSSERRADYGGLALVFAEAAYCAEAWKLALKEWNMIESKQVKEWQEQARKEGRQEGRVEILVQFLQQKFGNLPSDLPSHLQTINDASVFGQLLQTAANASNLDEFQRLMPNGTK